MSLHEVREGRHITAGAPTCAVRRGLQGPGAGLRAADGALTTSYLKIYETESSHKVFCFASSRASICPWPCSDFSMKGFHNVSNNLVQIDKMIVSNWDNKKGPGNQGLLINDG